MTITVSILQTGSVAVRPSQHTQPADRRVLLRWLRILADRRWTDPLPIYAYLVEHPDGPILFDTGESPRASHPGYYPKRSLYFRLAVDMRVGPDEGIATLLRQRGFAPTDLRAVVISHLHCDHADGMADLPGAPIYLSERHWRRFSDPVTASREGAVPSQWPADFAPITMSPTGPPIGPWENSYPITADGRVSAVDTPGHVVGHLSLVVRGDDVTYFLLGDASYNLDLLDAELTDGINATSLRAVETLRRIKEFARSENVVILPAHDPRAPRRLAHKEVYRPSEVVRTGPTTRRRRMIRT